MYCDFCVSYGCFTLVLLKYMHKPYLSLLVNPFNQFDNKKYSFVVFCVVKMKKSDEMGYFFLDKNIDCGHMALRLCSRKK